MADAESGREFLNGRLRAVARRLRGQSSCSGASRGLLLGAAGSVLVALITRFLPVVPALPVAGACLGAGLLGGLLWGFFRRISLLDAAAWADRIAGTEELLTTAYERRDSHFSPLLLSRATRILRERPVRYFKPRLTVSLPYLSLALIVVAAALLMLAPLDSTMEEDSLSQLSALKLQRMQRRVKELEKYAEETDDKELKKLQADLKKLVKALQDRELSKKEALARLAELSREADTVRQKLGQKRKHREALAKSPLTRALAEAISRADPAAAEREARALAGKLTSGALSSEERQALKAALDGMAGSSELSEAAAAASGAMERGEAGVFEAQMDRIAEQLQGGGGGKSDEAGEGQRELEGALSDLSETMEGLFGEELASASDFCPECGRRKPSPGST